ncbi:SMP-30/gluconolactonase/LRE family protein [Herbiconiux sp. L3-i23]|uniref:SMP-30/gluconolactonase/LRE family protein n=1 Tax=Herbiconiux sp. L3-i23 TaxID=2905871 RepID=UPI00206F8CDE|nr:SMP-30/gluconolactonase/LRE family protein [Herbiconiux sp. L3-i23]BDI22131.1 hypothetical protein L3i23_09070 [Herbiconiux sp. L3-i23]
MTSASSDRPELFDGPLRVWRDARAVLGESPWWSDGHLHWCDITTGTLHRAALDGDSDGSDDQVIRFPPPLASFAPREGGGYVVALGDRVVLTDAEGGSRREIAVIEHAHDGIRLNEGKCDPSGAFQVGSMDVTEGDPDGAVYLVTARGATTLKGGFGTANGFEWSLDDRTAYVTDTSAETIHRATWSPDAGLGELFPFVSGRSHDGLTLDRDGFLWGAVYGDGCVVRISPDGEVERVLDLPVPNVTSVAFGGDDLSTLFITTARENLTEDQLQQHPSSGAIFAVRTRTAGVPVRSFAG